VQEGTRRNLRLARYLLGIMTLNRMIAPNSRGRAFVTFELLFVSGCLALSGIAAFFLATLLHFGWLASISLVLAVVVVVLLLLRWVFTSQRRRDRFLRIFKGAVLVVLALYLLAYIIDSSLGGYSLAPERDGKNRFKPEFGGLSITDAILWQPRFGHQSLGRLDFWGAVFSPLIAVDRAVFHHTHYMMDAEFENWLKSLPASKVQPQFRDKFIQQSKKPSA